MDQKSILNDDEKQEIITDVKAAFNKASKNKKSNLIKSKQSKIEILIITLIIILIFATSIYWYLANNPKTIFMRSVDSTFETIETLIKEPKSDITKGIVKYNSNIKIAKEQYIELKNIDLKSSYTFDYLNNNLKANINLKKDNNLPTNFTLYKEDNILYFYSDELIDKYIKLDNQLFNYNKKDITTIIKSLNSAINSSLNSEKFTHKIENINIEDKKIKSDKTTLVIDNNNINIILDNIYNKLLQDKRFMTCYSQVFNIEKNQIKSQLLNTFNNLKNQTSDIQNITFNIYTEGIDHSFVKLDIITKYKAKIDTISINKTNKNKYSYIADLKTQNIKYEGNILIKEKENKTSYIIKSIITKNGIIVLDGEFKIKIIEQLLNTMKKEKINDSIKYFELSDEQKNKIKQKLSTNDIFSKYIIY